MTITWNRRERKKPTLVWKALLALGMVGLGLGAAYFRRRASLRGPKSEVPRDRGRGRANQKGEARRRGRGGHRRKSRGRRSLVGAS